MEKITKAHAFLADAIFVRYLEAVDKELVRIHGMPAHLVDAAHVHGVTVEIRVEQAQALDGLFAFLDWRGAGENEHLVGYLCC